MISGSFIRQLRQFKGVKQKVVAKKLGITQQAYSKIENSEQIKDETKKAIIDAIECSPHELEMLRQLQSAHNKR